MSPLYFDEMLLLIFGVICIAIVIFYRLIKNNLPNIYQTEKTFFSQFGNISLKPNSVFDYIAYLILLSVFALMIWNNFFPSGFKHFDTIGYVSEIACNFETIPLQIDWGRRFFPFAHQEWRVLSPLLAITNCSPYILFLLVTAQYFITAYLLFYIIPFEKLALRLITLAFIISNASFFIIFSSVIINDRNSLFLVVAFLYCFIYFFKTEKPIYLLVAFLCANTALYFKEPIFIYLISFAFTSFCFHLYQKQFRLIDIFSPIALIRKQPIEILLPLLSLCFASLWFIFAFILHPATETYGANDASYLSYILNRLQDYPLFALIILMIIGYIIDYKNIQRHQFSLILFIGGLFYAVAISLLKANHFYYYCISELSILLAACYYLNNISWQKHLKWQKNKWLAFAVLISVFILFDSIKSAHHLVVDMRKHGITQHRINVLQNHLPLDATKTNKIFYYNNKNNNQIYDNSVIFSTIKTIAPTPAFHFYSFQTYYQHYLEDQTEQSKWTQINEKTEQWNPDDYDFTIFARNRIDDATWQSLQAQYGDKMQKITNFPLWLGNKQYYDVYILQNDNDT
ncbi:MAG: hypothetical protein K0U39_02405 [Alphaproteobacteria bacterium]|nr:hypothetical protein [Alphaproteobacteria bacterium]